MKLKARPDESKYAVAIRDGNDLWLALWVSRISRPPEERFINVREPLLADLDDLRDKPLQAHVRTGCYGILALSVRTDKSASDV